MIEDIPEVHLVLVTGVWNHQGQNIHLTGTEVVMGKDIMTVAVTGIEDPQDPSIHLIGTELMIVDILEVHPALVTGIWIGIIEINMKIEENMNIEGTSLRDDIVHHGIESIQVIVDPMILVMTGHSDLPAGVARFPFTGTVDHEKYLNTLLVDLQNLLQDVKKS